MSTPQKTLEYVHPADQDDEITHIHTHTYNTPGVAHMSQ